MRANSRDFPPNTHVFALVYYLILLEPIDRTDCNEYIDTYCVITVRY